MTDIYQLFEVLKNMYDGEITLNTLGIHFGYIEGAIKEQKFVILFKPKEHLLVSVEQKHKDLLEELFPLLTLIMDSEKPICSYDRKRENSNNEIISTIEWDLVSPENRIQEIVNGKAFFDNSKISNLKLFVGNKIVVLDQTAQEQIIK